MKTSTAGIVEGINDSQRDHEEELRQRAQITSWQREIERMSAQLMAERRGMEFVAEERLTRRNGKILSRKTTRMGRKAYPRASTMNKPERPGKKGGAE